jgi:hypothetical protein
MASASVAAPRRTQSTRKSTKSQPQYYDPAAVIEWSQRYEKEMAKALRPLGRWAAPISSPADAKKAIVEIRRTVNSFEKDIRNLDNLSKLKMTNQSLRKKFAHIKRLLEGIEWAHIKARSHERHLRIRERAEKAIRDGRTIIKLSL